MKKQKFFSLMILFCIAILLASCGNDTEGLDEEGAFTLPNQYVLQGNTLYYISGDYTLCSYDIGTEAVSKLSDLFGKLYKTPWHILYVCGSDVYLIEDNILTKWKMLPEGTVYAASDDIGCYSVKYSEESKLCHVFYSEFSGSNPLHIVEEVEYEENFRLYPTENSLYCDTGKQIFTLTDKGNEPIPNIAYYNVCASGVNGILILEGKAAEYRSLYDAYYIADGVCTLIGENLENGSVIYGSEGFLLSSSDCCYVFSEAEMKLEKHDIPGHTSYLHTDIFYNGNCILGRIGYTNEFFIQTAADCTTFCLQ